MNLSLSYSVYVLGLGLFALIVAVAYVRVAVVLSVLRSALGFDALPRSVTTLLAVLLATFVMLPVVERAGQGVGQVAAEERSPETAAAITALGEFLDRHTPEAERRSFVELARRLRTPAERAQVKDKDLSVLAPAFVVAELKAAFEIGFLLFLPFLVLELVIASVLAALGMHALDPRAVSLPFKLLLFVAADGFHLLARGLVLAYT